jgi:hypothetical protein
MKRILEAILGLDLETKKRSIASIVMYVVAVLSIFGGIQVDDAKVDLIIKGLTAVALAITWAYGYYKNENYTPEGCEGTGYTRFRKKVNIDDVEVADDVDTYEIEVDNDEVSD